MFDLTGRVAVVTGASFGIGRSAALLLARHGASVALCARSSDQLAALQVDIAAAGGRALVATMDVGREDSVKEAIALAASRLGTVDLLINNAGVSVPTSLLETTTEDWDRVLDTNLRGAWHCAREVARNLIAAGRPGVIVNIASILGSTTQKGVGPYAASKAGLLQLTRVMAAEWARYDIRVNALAPGYIATDMTDDFLASDRGKKLVAAIPQRRIGRVDELAAPLLLLASAASSYMTGSTLVVDGGMALGQQ